MRRASSRGRSRRLVRSPDLACYWQDGRFVLEEFRLRRRVVASPLSVRVLSLFSEPVSAADAALSLPGFTAASVRVEVGKLARLGFLVPERKARPGLAAAWKGASVAAFFHFATKDLSYPVTPAAVERFYRGRLREEKQPPRFKEYPGRPRVPLAPWPAAGDSRPLADCLLARRTVRAFSRRPVPFASLAAVLGGGLGRTGWLVDRLLGRQLLKTSPSGGARHPVEGYCLAWNVEGLAPGLYHYSVKGHALERLRRGDFRDQAVDFASGQAWVRRAAFVVILTAVAQRTLWKYPGDDAYRVLLLDVGHVAQTLCLLAAAEGLGPFTTAALQESRIERFLGLDGVAEPPLYLFGAGVPSSARVMVTPSTRPRQP